MPSLKPKTPSAAQLAARQARARARERLDLRFPYSVVPVVVPWLVGR